MKAKGHLRGTASIEALMVIIVFVLVWIGVAYVGHLHHARIASKAEARTCAWRIAQSGCRSIPPECESSEQSGSLDGEGTDSLQDVGKEGGKQEESLGQRIADAFQKVLMNQIKGLFAKRVEASSIKEVPKPPVVGDGVVEVGGSFSLPCNTKEFSVEDIASDVWDRVRSD